MLPAQPRQTSITDIPLEIWFEIYSYLNPEQIVQSAQVSSSLIAIARDNLFWKHKFALHFADIYSELAKKPNQINWYEEFCTTYSEQYDNLSLDERRLLSLIKESQFDLIKLQTISLDSLYKRDKNDNSLLDWAFQLNKPKILAHLFEVAKTQLQGVAIDSQKRNLLHWAIATRQPLNVITELMTAMPALLIKQDVDENTPLMLAAAAGDSNAVQYFLQQEDNALTTANKNNQTALTLAIQGQHSAIAIELIRANTVAALMGHYVHEAASLGLLEVVQTLIEKNPMLLNHVNNVGETPLISAATANQLAVVNFLLRQANVNIDAVTQHLAGDEPELNGRTALFCAAEKGHVEVARALIVARANITLTPPDSGRLPLHVAAEQGHADIVKLLLETNRQQLNETDNSGQTALIWASATGKIAVVKDLVRRAGINLQATSQFEDHNAHGRSALHWAAANNHSEVVVELIAAGMNPNVEDSNQRTPILVAAQNNAFEAVTVLAKAPGVKANANPLDAEGYNTLTTLYLVIMKGDVPLIKTLLAAGADPSIKCTKFGYNGLDVAMKCNLPNSVEIYDLLCKAKPEMLQQVDQSGFTALMIVAYEGKHEIVSYLLANHKLIIDETTKNNPHDDHNGRTALYWAIAGSNDLVVSQLLNAGASLILESSPRKMQSIHIAAELASINIIASLLAKNSALLNAVNFLNETPLMLAARNGSVTKVEFLLKQPGIVLDTTTKNYVAANQNGKNALQLAIEKNQHNVVAAFLKHGIPIAMLKTLNKEKLSAGNRNKLALLEFISNRETALHQSPFTLFNKAKTEAELKAAQALKEVVLNGADKIILDPFQQELQQEELGQIFQSIQKK